MGKSVKIPWIWMSDVALNYQNAILFAMATKGQTEVLK